MKDTARDENFDLKKQILIHYSDFENLSICNFCTLSHVIYFYKMQFLMLSKPIYENLIGQKLLLGYAQMAANYL